MERFVESEPLKKLLRHVSARPEMYIGIAAVVASAVAYAALRRKTPQATVASRIAMTESNISELSAQEKAIERDFIGKDKINVDFSDIGGLRDQIREIEDLVLLPLSHRHLYQHSRVAQQPTGILLYGPPGTGKTLLAKAIAKSAAASFLSVNVASLESKWFGETPKLIEAMFTLARKRAPCVVFIDEIDGFLSSRRDGDSQHVNTMKTVFMENWDGLSTPTGDDATTGLSTWVLVVAATNKPWAIDPAVLRRVPRQIFVGLPDEASRTEILRVFLRHERAEAGADIAALAALTEGYSGSDLKEVVRAASLIPIREAFSRETLSGDRSRTSTPRAIATADLLSAAHTVKASGTEARSYKYAQSTFATAFGAAQGASASTPVAGGARVPKGSSPEEHLTQAEPGITRAFLEFGHSTKLNSANLTRAVEAMSKSPTHSFAPLTTTATST